MWYIANFIWNSKKKHLHFGETKKTLQINKNENSTRFRCGYQKQFSFWMTTKNQILIMVLIFLLNIVTYKDTLETISNLMEEIWWLIRGLSVLGSQIFLSNYRLLDLYIVGLLQVIQLWISDYAFISTQYKNPKFNLQKLLYRTRHITCKKWECFEQRLWSRPLGSTGSFRWEHCIQYRFHE